MALIDWLPLYVLTFTVYCTQMLPDRMQRICGWLLAPRRPSAVNEQAARPRAPNHHCCTPVLVTWLYSPASQITCVTAMQRAAQRSRTIQFWNRLDSISSTSCI